LKFQINGGINSGKGSDSLPIQTSEMKGGDLNRSKLPNITSIKMEGGKLKRNKLSKIMGTKMEGGNLNMKKLLNILGILVLIFFVITTGEVAGKEIVIRLGHVQGVTSHYHLGALKFAELVKEKSNGEVKVNIYPNSQLGSAKELLEGLPLGTVEMTMTAAPQSFAPATGVLALPYLFRDREHAYKVLDGPLAKEIYDKATLPKGVRVLAAWEAGFRQVLSKSDDFKGLKIRVPTTKLWAETFKAIGSSPTPMAYGEVYTALQQGVMDALENPLSSIVEQKFYEVAKEITITNHLYGAIAVVISEKFFQKLTPENQKAVQEGALEARHYQRQVSKEKEEEAIKVLKKAGINIYEVDLAPFQEAMKVIYGTSGFDPKVIEQITKTK
jgi:tripartite ATP-independent transporter DctP family solute receptor